MEVSVTYTEHMIESYYSSEPYGSWSETMEFTVTGAHLSKQTRKSNDLIPVDFPLEVGDYIFVLYLIYSNGDSFGNCRGRGEIIWVYKTLEAAEFAREIWESTDEYLIDTPTESGGIVKLHNPAYNYFSSTQRVGIECVEVQE